MTEQKVLSKVQTKEKALRLLEFRNHSEYELRQKLKRAGALDENIDEVVEFCREYGFLNDGAYALSLARDLNKIKKYGKHRIYQELKKRGLSSLHIDNALCEIEDDKDTLLMLVSKKLNGDFDSKHCDKVIRYFMYRGYQLTDIKNAIERLITNEL